MKTKKLWYGLLVGVASVWLAYACQSNVASVEKAGQEAGTALVDKAKAYFESAIRQQVYTRGVADVYEEAQDEESGFIPSDYTPMWSRSFVAEEGNWKQVAAPVATFDKSYICTPDGEVDELAQAVVYREEAGFTVRKPKKPLAGCWCCGRRTAGMHKRRWKVLWEMPGSLISPGWHGRCRLMGR